MTSGCDNIITAMEICVIFDVGSLRGALRGLPHTVLLIPVGRLDDRCVEATSTEKYPLEDIDPLYYYSAKVGARGCFE